MRHLAALAMMMFAVLPASAEEIAPAYFGQIPLLPLTDGEHADLEKLVREHWGAYWRAPGAQGFGRDQLRAGRFDLDGNGEAELFMLIDADSWHGERGKPLVVARWSAKGWLPIGWSWADTDSVFATVERRDGWRTLDTGTQLLRWRGRAYEPVEKQG